MLTTIRQKIADALHALAAKLAPAGYRPAVYGGHGEE